MPNEREHQTMSLDSGLQIGVAEYGDLDGKPLLFFHGFPGSRFEAQLLEQGATERGLRVIAVDRPGFGLSDFVPDRRLLDWPGVVVELAAKRGLEKFSILAVSGGAPYAYACAKEIHERIDTLGVVCGMGPYGFKPAIKAMNGIMRFGLGLSHRAPWAGSAFYRCLAGLILTRWPKMILKIYGKHARPADREILSQEANRAIFRRSFHEAFSQGTRGPARDLVILAGDWGFKLEDINMTVHLWHGEKDPTVPVQFSKLAHEQLPDSTLSLHPDDGHFSLPICRTSEILDRFADR